MFVVFQNVFLRMTSFYERVLGVLNDDGAVCLLVCPGTKFCLQLQSFCLGSAECRWDRGEWRRMDFIPIGGKEIESGFVLFIYLKMMNGQGP